MTHCPGSSKIRERRLRFAGHCIRSDGETVSKVILWTPKHGTRRPGRQQLTFMDILRQDTVLEGDDIRTACKTRVFKEPSGFEEQTRHKQAIKQAKDINLYFSNSLVRIHNYYSILHCFQCCPTKYKRSIYISDFMQLLSVTSEVS